MYKRIRIAYSLLVTSKQGEHTISTTNYGTLAEALAHIPDPRSAQGQCYEWQFLLILIGAALMSGKQSLPCATPSPPYCVSKAGTHCPLAFVTVNAPRKFRCG